MHVPVHPAQSIFRLPRIVLFLTLLGLCAFAAACSDSDPVRPQADDPVATVSAVTQTRYISILEGESTLADAQDFADAAKLTLVSFSPSTRLAVLEGKKNFDRNSAESGSVTFDEATPVNLSTPIDLLMGFQEFFELSEADAQEAFTLVDWDLTHDYAFGAGVKIAILDSGADFSHPWLQYRLVDLGVEGLPSADEAWDQVDSDHRNHEAWGHGTHVAGIIAATAPGAELWPIPVLSPAGASTSVELAIGLQAALDHGADIVNLSLRLEGFDATVENLLQQLQEAGVHVMAAAGNVEFATQKSSDGTPVYPASSPYTTAVAMVDNADALHPQSCYGPETVELAAPGVGVVSAYPSENNIKPFARASGTSMACASASGALACIMGQHDRPRPSPPLERLLETAGPIDKVKDGRIRPTNALMIFPGGF